MEAERENWTRDRPNAVNPQIRDQGSTYRWIDSTRAGVSVYEAMRS